MTPSTNPLSVRNCEPADKRLTFLAFQEKAECEGRTEIAAAYHRIALLVEVWECLGQDAPAIAAELATFCDDAAEALSDANTATESERASSWVLRESSERWPEFLGALEPEMINPVGTSSDTRTDRDAEDNEPAIDSDALIRMLTGGKATDDRQPSQARTAVESKAEPPVSNPVAPLPERVRAKPVLTGRLGLPETTKAITIDADLRDTFLAEAGDLFDRIESLVVDLGNGQPGEDVLPELGRCFHTLKGAAGSVGLVQVAAMVHAMEDRLDGCVGVQVAGLLEPLHQLLGYLEAVFASIRTGKPQIPEAASTGPVSKKGSGNEPAALIRPTSSLPSHHPNSFPEASPTPIEGWTGEGPVRVSAERIDELMDLVSELITRRGLWASQSEMIKEFATMARSCRTRLLSTTDKLRDLEFSRETSLECHDSPVRIARDPELHGLIRRVAEQADDVAVLTESAQAFAKPLSDNCEALARLTLKLWESLQSIRVLPVRGLFQRLTRVAQDAARVEGRQVEVIMIGEETGLDRAVLDKAVEPLLHVVRNAVCHGIETPSDRVAKGKQAAGRVTLQACRAGNTIVISVVDDGRGLDYEAIAAKGRRLGLIGPNDVSSLERLNALIFQSGFSTREEASAIAGRGVGMDVVSQEVSRLHGTISLTSTNGQGTRLSISLPARLALEQAMISKVDGRSFALPVDLIEQAEPFEPSLVDRTGTWPKVAMREHWVPLIDAREALGIAPSASGGAPRIVSLRADGERLALVVDAIEGTGELAIKPLSPLLSGHPIVSGTSLSVTGEVIFALNPSGLARRLRDFGGSSGPDSDLAEKPRLLRVLVVDDSISVRKVVARQLTALGYEVEEVSDGLEALGKLRTHSYSLVVSDLEMPRMDGFELLAELARLGILKSLPVLIASTRSDPDTRQKALDLGAREFLPKPIALEELAAKARGSMLETALASESIFPHLLSTRNDSVNVL